MRAELFWCLSTSACPEEASTFRIMLSDQYSRCSPRTRIFRGPLPGPTTHSISVSSEKLSNVRMTMVAASNATLSNVRGAVIVALSSTVGAGEGDVLSSCC
jgi:hypothetical protein